MSEASAYRILKAHDLITSPAFIVVKAADEFKDKTKWAGARFPETVRCATDRIDGGRAWTERMDWNRL